MEGGEEAMKHDHHRRYRHHRPWWMKKLRLDYETLFVIVIVGLFQVFLWQVAFR